METGHLLKHRETGPSETIEKNNLFCGSESKNLEKQDVRTKITRSPINYHDSVKNPASALLSHAGGSTKSNSDPITFLTLGEEVESRMKGLNPKKFRKITNRKTRKRVLQKFPTLLKLSKCNSKLTMVKVYETLSSKWKHILRLYMTRCFIFHLHVRQIRDFTLLFRQRHALYLAIDSPSVLMQSINFSNNLVKNFCKGFTNFVVMFYEDFLQHDLLPPSPVEPVSEVGGFGLSIGTEFNVTGDRGEIR